MLESDNSTDCLLGSAFEVEAEVFYLPPPRRLFHRLHFLSKRFHSLQHGCLKDSHLLLKLDVELVT